MSVLNTHLRPLIVSNLREDMNPRIKKVMMKLFNAVDSDLDLHSYNIETGTVTEETEEAIEELEKVLASFNTLDEEEDTSGLPEKVEHQIIPEEEDPLIQGGEDIPDDESQ